MVLWGITGVLMWWQIKPTRLVGVAGISIAAVVAFLVTVGGTLEELEFSPPRSRGGRPTSPPVTVRTNAAERASNSERREASGSGESEWTVERIIQMLDQYDRDQEIKRRATKP